MRVILGCSTLCQTSAMRGSDSTMYPCATGMGNHGYFLYSAPINCSHLSVIVLSDGNVMPNYAVARTHTHVLKGEWLQVASGCGRAANFSNATSRHTHVHNGVLGSAGDTIPMHRLEGDVLDLEPRYTLVHQAVHSVQIMAEHETSHLGLQNSLQKGESVGLEGATLTLSDFFSFFPSSYLILFYYHVQKTIVGYC